MNSTQTIRLRWLHGTIAHVTQDLTGLRFSRSAPHVWRPAINAYRCGDRFIICVDLAGVEKDGMQVLAETRRLIIRGKRRPPEPDCDQPQPVQVLAMEIDYGPFERVLELPDEVDTEGVNAEHSEGLLWVYLPLRLHS